MIARQFFYFFIFLLCTMPPDIMRRLWAKTVLSVFYKMFFIHRSNKGAPWIKKTRDAKWNIGFGSGRSRHGTSCRSSFRYRNSYCTVVEIAGSKTNKELKLTGTYPFIVGFLEKNKSDFLEIRAGLKNRQNQITERKQPLASWWVFFNI